MKIASWNVNSLKVRLPQVLEWLRTSQTDVLALQETKCTDENFPLAAFEDYGLHVAFSGQKTYNGVAIISRFPISELQTDLTGLDDPQRRVLFATVNGVRIMNVYIVNGSEVGSEKYAYKLKWLQHLQADVTRNLAQHEQVVLLGDYNIAPADSDVHNPKSWQDKILCSQPERQAFQNLLDAGMVDTFRQFDQAEKSFSWWDYRSGGFPKNMGLRIDCILASKKLAQHTVSSIIDKEPRAWNRPSDHTPVVAEFSL